jgi:signal transduction histidine kinase
MQTKVASQIFVAFLAIMALLTAMLVGVNRTSVSYIDNNRWLLHTQQVLSTAETLYSAILKQESGIRGYVITRDSTYYAQSQARDRHIRNLIALISQLTIDNPRQQEALTLLENYVENRLAINYEAAQKLKAGLAPPPRGEGKRVMGLIEAQLQSIKREEERLLQTRTGQNNQLIRNFSNTLVLLEVSVGVALLILFWVIRSYLAERRASDQQLTLLNSELGQRNQALSHVNEELESFTYSVSHDLRQPLRAINGYSQMMREEFSAVLDKEGHRLLDRIQQNARQMGQLIDDLLSFSRLSRTEMRHVEADLNEVVSRALAELGKTQDLSLIEIDREPLPTVKGDFALLRQVYINLIGNAIKYSGTRERPYLRIGSRQVQGSTLYFVQDNGVGFDMQYVHKLFTVFQRLHGAHEFSGTGVGLAIVKRIVTRHEGEIMAEGRLNGGATFSFTLHQPLPEVAPLPGLAI